MRYLRSAKGLVAVRMIDHGDLRATARFMDFNATVAEIS
jgi:hypothetical protein